MERDFKGVWIPKEIWLSRELSAIEELLKRFSYELESLEKIK